MNGWDFHYKVWKTEVPKAHDGATQGNLFPSERVGSLDMTKFCKCGLIKQRMVANDASTIHDDGRQAYYTSVMDWTAMYAIEANYNSRYGHAFKNPQFEERVRFYGIVIRDEVKGGSNGVI
jgi:hypothetical protein